MSDYEQRYETMKTLWQVGHFHKEAEETARRHREAMKAFKESKRRLAKIRKKK